MAAKKPAKPTKLQQKAAKSDKVLTGPKGSKPQSTTTNRVRTQGGTTMSKPKPKPAAKPKPPAAKPATPSGGGKNLFGGAGSKPAAINKADSQKAPQPAFRTSKPPFSSTGKPTRPSLGNVRPGPAAAAAPRQIAQAQARAQGQANVRAAQLRRENIARVQRDLRGQVGKATALLGGLRGGAVQAIADVVTPKPTAKGTLKGGGAQGPAMPKRLEQQGLAAQERKARAKNEARKKATGSSAATPNTAKSFDSAFRDARRAKVSTFIWRGKKYTTEMK